MPPREIAARVGPEHSAHIEQKGDRITTLAFDSAAFFSRGDAILNGSGKVILQEVIGNLKSEEYRDYMITIEGHTDDTPINTAQFPSNWELSTARAAAVTFLRRAGRVDASSSAQQDTPIRILYSLTEMATGSR